MLTTTVLNVLPVQVIFENTRRAKQSFLISPKILKIEFKMEHFSIFESNLVKSVFYKINYEEKIMTVPVWHHIYDVIKKWLALFDDNQYTAIRYGLNEFNSENWIYWSSKIPSLSKKIINSQEYENILKAKCTSFGTSKSEVYKAYTSRDLWTNG